MSHEFNELLSAAMDGEVSSFELRRLLTGIQESKEFEGKPSIKKWQRYHLAQQVIHGEASRDEQFINIDLVSRVSAALENEKDPQVVGLHTASSVENPEKHAWWKPVMSMAMAASVTAVVILGGQQFASNDAGLDDSFRQAYSIPSVQSSQDLIRAQYSNYQTSANKDAISSSGEPEVIRLSQGLNRYIEQHRHLLSSSEPAWQADWLPEGYTQVRHEMMPHAEVMVFSDGKHSVSISIEPLGRQSVAPGVVQSNNIVAVGRAVEDGFVTVVGDVPLMIADRIAVSVKSVR